MQKDIVHELLTQMEPTIETMVENIEKHFIKEYGKAYTIFQRELCKLSLIYDMIRSFEKYTAPSDILENFKIYNSPKGVTIDANIIRYNKSYKYLTEVIIAGGVNIQTLHYRYITKTKLPKTDKCVITLKYCGELKIMKKIEKFYNEIAHFEKIVSELKNLIDTNTKLTDDDILNKLSIDRPNLFITWDDIIKNGACENYNNSIDFFEKIKKNDILRSISSWKTLNIVWKNRSLMDYYNNIKKTNDKINKLEIELKNINNKK